MFWKWLKRQAVSGAGLVKRQPTHRRFLAAILVVSVLASVFAALGDILASLICLGVAAALVISLDAVFSRATKQQGEG